MDPRGTARWVEIHLQMPLVAHHSPNEQAGVGCALREITSMVGGDTTTGKTHIDVDEDLGDSSRCGSAECCVGIDGHSDACACCSRCVDHRRESIDVDDLVRKKQIVSEPGRGENAHLSWCGACKCSVAVRRLTSRYGRAFVRLHMGTKRAGGQAFSHEGKVLLKACCLHHEGWRWNISYVHLASMAL